MSMVALTAGQLHADVRTEVEPSATFSRANGAETRCPT